MARPSQLDNFKPTVNMQIDFDEFRPIQVIDYQNKTQTSVPFVHPSSFPNVMPPSNMRKSEEIFHRKVIEYDHKSKTHPWNWFCPVIQIEYNHTPNGFSLHEYPPPPPPKPRPEQQPIKPEFGKRDHFPFKQPKWQQNERQDRMFHTNPNERYHQPRFENRQSNDMQSYSRRNPQERNWSRNYNECNNPRGNHGYDR